MNIAVPRLVLALLVIGSLFPLTAVGGLFWSAMMMGWGLTMMYKGAIAGGLLMLVWSACAFYGLVIVIELVAHFWRSPWENPRGRVLIRSVTGLVMGWVSIPLLIPTVGRDPLVGGYAFGASLLLVPVSLAISLWLAGNYIRQRRQGNLRPS